MFSSMAADVPKLRPLILIVVPEDVVESGAKDEKLRPLIVIVVPEDVVESGAKDETTGFARR